MTLLAATFTITPCDEAMLPQWSGVLVRDWLMARLAATNPALHETITSAQVKPYTVSAVWNTTKPAIAAGTQLTLHVTSLPRISMQQTAPQQTGTQLTFRITSLQDDLTRWMQDEFVSQQAKTLTLGKQLFTIENVTITTTTAATLLDEFALQTGHLSRRIRVSFDSPTAFRRHSLSFSLPLPDWVFGHWLDKWNLFNPQKLHPDARKYAAECITVSGHRLHSRFLEFEDTSYSPISGTVGYVQFNMVKGDRYWQSLMHALAAYGVWAGSGVRTTVGMGQTRIEISRTQKLNE